MFATYDQAAFIKNAPDPGFHQNAYPRVILDDGALHMFHEDYRVLPEGHSSWRLTELPFRLITGFSATGTPHGIVVYGGEKAGVRSSDIWIGRGDNWVKLSASAGCRAHHACTWIPAKNALLIHGGRNGDPLSDFKLLNVQTGEVTDVKTSRHIALMNHTVTSMGGSSVLLVGGVDEDGRVNDRIFEVDVSIGTVTCTSVEMERAVRVSHSACCLFGCLLVSGGFRSERSPVTYPCLFDVKHNMWLEMDMDFYFRDFQEPWIMIPVGNGISVLDATAGNMKTLYYAEDKSAVTGPDDPKILEFMSALMEGNTSPDQLQNAAEDNDRLMERVDTIANALSTRNEQHDDQPILNMNAEVHLLRRKIARAEGIYNRQQKRTKALEKARPNDKASEHTPRGLMREIVAEKKAMKVQMKELMKTADGLHAKLEALGRFPQTVTVSAQTRTVAEKLVDVPTLEALTTRARKDLIELKKENLVRQERISSMDDNYIAALEYLAKKRRECRDAELESRRVGAEYYALQRQLTEARNDDLMDQSSIINQIPDVMPKYKAFLAAQQQGNIYADAAFRCEELQLNVKALLASINGILVLSIDSAQDVWKPAIEKLISNTMYVSEIRDKIMESIDPSSEKSKFVATPDLTIKPRTEANPNTIPSAQAISGPSPDGTLTGEGFYKSVMALLHEVESLETGAGIPTIDVEHN